MVLSDGNSRVFAILAVGAALIALFLAAGLIGAFGNGVPQELWASAGALSGALVGVLVPSPKAPPTPSATAAVSVVDGAALQAANATGDAIVAADATQRAAVNTAVDAVKRTTFRSLSGTVNAAATTAVAQHEATAALATGNVSEQVTQAAATAAATALPAAQDHSRTAREALPSWITWLVSALWQIVKPLALAVITYEALRTGIHLSDGTLGYHSCPVTTPIPAKGSAAPCATALFQAGTALITLGAAAGGALVGLFAPPSHSGSSSSSGAGAGAG